MTSTNPPNPPKIQPTSIIQKQYGVTPAISLAPPTAADAKLTEELEKSLRQYNLFESREESQKREEVLGKLNVIVKEWVRQLSLKKGFSEQLAAEAGAKIFTFGSYRLGVQNPGSDIDTLCVAPRHVDRNDFFTSLYESLSRNPEISGLTSVPDAYVPVINMRFCGISIDLLFARLALTTIPENLDLLDENILKNLDEKSVLSLNGCRVTDQILKLVPNVPNFRLSLRCIKFWAKKRGIYANIVGFLGGVSWALLTARICQLYPNASPNILVSRFFRVFEQWKWPNPVILNNITEGPLGLKVWNPKIHYKDRSHLMPIITPAYPAMNSTYNVSESTKAVLKEEFARGAQTTFKIEQEGLPWSTLFEKSNFFAKYRAYIQIDVFADTEDEHRKWEGLVESKLRFLIQKLEQTPNMKYAHPLTHGIVNHVTENDTKKYNTSFFMGLTLNIQKNSAGSKTVDLTPAASEFSASVKDWPEKTSSMDLRIRFIPRAELPDFIFASGDYDKLKPPSKRKNPDSAPSSSKSDKSALSPTLLKKSKTQPSSSTDQSTASSVNTAPTTSSSSPLSTPISLSTPPPPSVSTPPDEPTFDDTNISTAPTDLPLD